MTPATYPTGSVRGRLLLPDGSPAQGIPVTLPGARQSVATSAQGEFAFAAVRPGTYGIFVDATGYQRVMHHQLSDPAAHIAALGEFARVLRSG